MGNVEGRAHTHGFHLPFGQEKRHKKNDSPNQLRRGLILAGVVLGASAITHTPLFEVATALFEDKVKFSPDFLRSGLLKTVHSYDGDELKGFVYTGDPQELTVTHIEQDSIVPIVIIGDSNLLRDPDMNSSHGYNPEQDFDNHKSIADYYVTHIAGKAGIGTRPIIPFAIKGATTKQVLGVISGTTAVNGRFFPDVVKNLGKYDVIYAAGGNNLGMGAATEQATQDTTSIEQNPIQPKTAELVSNAVENAREAGTDTLEILRFLDKTYPNQVQRVTGLSAVDYSLLHAVDQQNPDGYITTVQVAGNPIREEFARLAAIVLNNHLCGAFETFSRERAWKQFFSGQQDPTKRVKFVDLFSRIRKEHLGPKQHLNEEGKLLAANLMLEDSQMRESSETAIDLYNFRRVHIM